MLFADPKAQPRLHLDTEEKVEFASFHEIKTCDRGSGSNRMVYLDGDHALAKFLKMREQWTKEQRDFYLAVLESKPKLIFRWNDKADSLIISHASAALARTMIFGGALPELPAGFIIEG